MIGLHVTLRLPSEREVLMTPASKELLDDPRTGAGVDLYNYLPMHDLPTSIVFLLFLENNSTNSTPKVHLFK